MTPEQLAARWLADCASDAREVYADTCKTAIEAIDYMEQLALAAISRHLAPGDDLVERLSRADEYEPLGHDGWEAAARLSALTAQVGEWQDLALEQMNRATLYSQEAEAAEAEASRLRDRLARMEGERDDALSAARQQDRLREATLATLRGVSADLEASETKSARLLDALTPSADTKAAYMGEFSIPFPTVDENGNEVMLRPNVPWTTIKEIMAAIHSRAALTESPADGGKDE